MKTITLIIPSDRAGTLAEIARALAAADVNIAEMDAADDHVHAVIHLVAEPHDKALRALAEAGFSAVSGHALLIRLKDEPGALAKVADRFKEAALNVRTMVILRRDGGHVSVALSTDDDAKAAGLLADCLVRRVG